MKKRTYSLCTLGLAALLGTVLFLTSEKVQRAEKEFNALRDKVKVEQDSLRVLRAEWAYLNRPDRLEQLAATHLKLAPATTNQITSTVAILPEHIDTQMPDNDDVAKPTLASAPAPTPVTVAQEPDTEAVPAPVKIATKKTVSPIIPVALKTSVQPTIKVAATTAPKPTPAARTAKDGNTQTFYQMLNHAGAPQPSKSTRTADAAYSQKSSGTFYDR